MKEKKVSPDWYIAATHWLTAGFVVPFLLALVLGIPLAIILGKDNITLLSLSFVVINVLSVWLGVMYSAKYLAKTYIIKDSNQIAILATVFLVLVGGGFRVHTFMQTGVFAYEYIGFIIGIFVFYFTSKIYIKNSH
ncbi:MAG: hypothetical protein JWP09_163 [Candidatus Taylorbacteria bacterium]|nr:hypothetical protein [Candidatus Taylorbacteria bacterium]